MTREQEVLLMLHGVFQGARSCLQGHRVVRFGSRTRGVATLRSDFDIGVMGDEPLSFGDFYALADQIENLPTLYRIDWVDLARVSERFRQSALSTAEVIYEA